MTSTPVITDFGPDSGGRVKGVTIIKPVVLGNVARPFGKKRDEDGHTHQWTVYLKPFENEDYSMFIKKVQFKLHESYPNPTRIVSRPPYEVTETGWGEFEINIRVYFQDPTERPITFCHILKLFQSGTDALTANIGKKPLVAETYDEIIFQDPTALLKSLLEDIKPITTSAYFHETNFEEKRKQSEAQIQAAKLRIRSEIQILKEQLELSRTTIQKFKTAIASVTEKGLPTKESSAARSGVTSSVATTQMPKDVKLKHDST